MTLMKKVIDWHKDQFENPKPFLQWVHLDDGDGNKETHVNLLGSEFHSFDRRVYYDNGSKVIEPGRYKLLRKDAK